jgi:hypothetical protein
MNPSLTLGLPLVELLIAVVFIAFLEYAAHRWILHRRFIVVGVAHLLHHKVFTKNFVGPEPLSAFDISIIRMALLSIAYTFLLVPVCFVSPLLYFWIVVAGSVHAYTWNEVHNEMHRPTGTWWGKTRYFKRIRYFHFVHHHYPRVNYGFLFAPVFDILFRTYRASSSRQDVP